MVATNTGLSRLKFKLISGRVTEGFYDTASYRSQQASQHKQFTKKNLRCQRGGVRGVANQNASPKRSTWQTE